MPLKGRKLNLGMLRNQTQISSVPDSDPADESSGCPVRSGQNVGYTNYNVSQYSDIFGSKQF